MCLVRRRRESAGAPGAGAEGQYAERPGPRGPDRGRARRVVVPVLVIGSFLGSVVASVAAGVEPPYPGSALGSGLVLVLERAAAVWAFSLLALVIVDQGLRGRLPVEIGGRGVRYSAEQQAVEVVVAHGDLGDRVSALEVAFEVLERREKSS